MIKSLFTLALFLCTYGARAQAPIDSSAVTDTTVVIPVQTDTVRIDTSGTVPIDTTVTVPADTSGIVIDTALIIIGHIDTVQMDIVCCPVNNLLAKCKRVKGFGIIKRGPALVTCTNSTGYESIDTQVYLDDQKKVIDSTKFDIFYK